MKYLKKYEGFSGDAITDGILTIDDLVHVKFWPTVDGESSDAKILKVYDDSCLVEFKEDGYQTIIPKNELILFSPEEIQSIKYNL